MPKAIIYASLLSGLLVFQGCTEEQNTTFTPEPVTLDALVSEIGSRQGDVVVVNFWATWCAPCRIEFPELVQFGRDFENRGVDVVFVSTDFESDVPLAAEFLQEQQVPWATYIKTGVDQNFIDAFHMQWSGALPATFVYDRDGHLRAFWEGITSYDELERTVSSML
jgi:thiol-disulfide isomerase/thioredoxin